MRLHEVMDANPFGTIYVTGRMTGDPNHAQKFGAVQEDLEALFPNATVANPAEMNPLGAMSWEAALRMDLKIVVDAVALVAMEGWRQSRGARLEVHVAKELGIPVYRYPSFRRVA